jgi:hypothetical protein
VLGLGPWGGLGQRCSLVWYLEFVNFDGLLYLFVIEYRDRIDREWLLG